VTTGKIISLIVVILIGLAPVGWFFFQRQRQKVADKTGKSLLATIVSAEWVGTKRIQAPMMKIKVWFQEPGVPAREATMTTRVPPGQDPRPGMRIPIVIDPKNPAKVYPASEEAAKRAMTSGSRAERRQLKKQKF
jgi:hypothetical protein